MIVQRFVRWCRTASSRQRAEGYQVVARAFLDGRVPVDEREAAIAALHMALDDPSPMVRQGLAAVVASHEDAPRTLLIGLLDDNDEIAACVARSPVLTSDDLLRALATSREFVQIAIAARRRVSLSVAAAVAWRCGAAPCRTLLANEGAEIPAAALRRLSDRFGDDPEMRALLAERADLPADVRQVLVLESARLLQASALVRRTLGDGQAHRALFHACERATTMIGEDVEPAGVPAFVEHLRVTGQLSPAFLIRNACLGNIDLLAAVLTALSGLSEPRVRAIVVDGRDGPFRSMMADCGIAEPIGRLIRIAVRIWKETATRRQAIPGCDGIEVVVARILAAFRLEVARPSPGTTAMLRAIEGELTRDAMRARRDMLLAA